MLLCYVVQFQQTNKNSLAPKIPWLPCAIPARGALMPGLPYFAHPIQPLPNYMQSFLQNRAPTNNWLNQPFVPPGGAATYGDKDDDDEDDIDYNDNDEEY